jgi:hypothetical protein
MACVQARRQPSPSAGALTHDDSAAIFIALADTLWNAYGDAPPYVAGDLPRWLADTLRTTAFFARPCNMRVRRCREPRPGLAFLFGPLRAEPGSDSALVWVTEDFHPPPRSPSEPEWAGFGASIRYTLRKVGLRWRVVRVTVELIS